MKSAKDYNSKNETVDSISDEPAALSSADQALDELYALLAESSSEIDTEDESEVSVLEKVQAMYSSSDELEIEDASKTESVSIMEELEAMYGSSNETIIDGESSSDDTVSEAVSIMDELEAMYGDLVEPATGNESEKLAALQSAGASYEEDIDSLLALNNLTDAVSESTSHEIDDSSDISSSANYDYLFENRKSVLDELQNLLQSSVEELKAKVGNHISQSTLTLDMEYPTRNELINLLEEKLRQLRLISDASGNFTFDEGAVVLDELSALMTETGSRTSAASSYTPSDQTSALVGDDDINIPDDVDDYVAYINAKYKNAANNEVIAGNTVPDEFVSQQPDTSSIDNSELTQDVLSVFEDDEKINTDLGSDELDVYLADSSEYLTNDMVSSVDVDANGLAQDVEYNELSAEPDSSLSALDQLEKMMAETTISENDAASEGVSSFDNDSVTQQVSSYLSNNDEENEAEPAKFEHDTTVDSELAEYVSSISGDDEKTDADSEPDELDAYLAAPSEYLTNDVTSPVDADINSSVEEIKNDEASTESDNELSALDQLEEMLAETTSSENDVLSEDISGNDSVSQQELSESNDRIHPAEAYRDRLKHKTLVDETYLPDTIEAKKSSPVGSILLIVAVVVGVIFFWNLFGGGDDRFDRLQSDPVKLAENEISLELEAQVKADAQELADARAEAEARAQAEAEAEAE
ncbi:MAG: hypothetical protein ABUK13_00185, partial [Gammaproteobacteria bacterium]